MTLTTKTAEQINNEVWENYPIGEDYECIDEVKQRKQVKFTPTSEIIEAREDLIKDFEESQLHDGMLHIIYVKGRILELLKTDGDEKK